MFKYLIEIVVLIISVLFPCRMYIYVIYAIAILVDCEWDDWVEGDCSATCGTGQQTNTRVKLTEEANGGTCTGKSTNVTSCLVVECPGT